MEKRNRFIDRLNDDLKFTPDTFPLSSILEIVDDRRVLVENHTGIRAYSKECIIVNLRMGYVTISGCSLEILRMTKSQLIICGVIKAVSIERRK